MSASERIKGSPPTTDIIKVLIADDDPPTRILLRAAISQWGYEVIEASNGEEAWDILQHPNPPRLLILDWLMPKLDGINLCERIKREQVLHPYTILLTQVTGTTNIIKGLEAGADEFLSKPFNMAELRSRLSVGARIIRFENALAEQNVKVQSYAAQMESLAQAHAKSLVYHADLLSLLGPLIESISQEIYDTLLQEQKKDQASTENSQKIEALHTNFARVITLLKRLQINSIYTPKTNVCQLNELIQQALDLCKTVTRSVKIELKFGNQLPSISADPEKLQELFLGLILSALESEKKEAHPLLRIETKLSEKNTIQIIIEDNGTPFSDHELKILSHPQVSSQDLEQIHSRLSIPMSKEIIKKYGGSLEVENCTKSGIRLTLNLPLKLKSLERDDA